MVWVNTWVFILRRYKWHIHAGSWSLVNCWRKGSCRAGLIKRCSRCRTTGECWLSDPYHTGDEASAKHGDRCILRFDNPTGIMNRRRCQSRGISGSAKQNSDWCPPKYFFKNRFNVKRFLHCFPICTRRWQFGVNISTEPITVCLRDGSSEGRGLFVCKKQK